MRFGDSNTSLFLSHTLRVRAAHLDTILQRTGVVGIRELDDLQLVGLLQVLDPLVGLALRVDHQGPAVGIGDYQGVVCGETAQGATER